MENVFESQSEFGQFEIEYQADDKAGTVGYRCCESRTGYTHLRRTEKTEDEYCI